jgi:hypothetical protein
MLGIFEELAQITGAELCDALDEVQAIDCLGAAFSGEHGAFRVTWNIQLDWASFPVQLIVHPGDVEQGEDWLIERFAHCIIDSLSQAEYFIMTDVTAVA